jgi:hypothetical protein
MGIELFFKKQEAVTKEVIVSDRFVDGEGKPVAFRIKSITAKDDQILKNACVTIDMKTKLPKTDTGKYQAMLCAACVVYPDLGSAELQDSYGVRNKPDLLSEMLLPGELATLMEEVAQLNGFKPMRELIDEAKN